MSLEANRSPSTRTHTQVRRLFRGLLLGRTSQVVRPPVWHLGLHPRTRHALTPLHPSTVVAWALEHKLKTIGYTWCVSNSTDARSLFVRPDTRSPTHPLRTHSLTRLGGITGSLAYHWSRPIPTVSTARSLAEDHAPTHPLAFCSPAVAQAHPLACLRASNHPRRPGRNGLTGNVRTVPEQMNHTNCLLSSVTSS
jgi:hypothetical protein